VLDCRGWKRPVLSPRGTSTFGPTRIQTQVNPCDVQVLLNINMLLEKGKPCVSMNDIMPVRQALRETLAESERPYSYKM
jgi:hypothetical protein